MQKARLLIFSQLPSSRVIESDWRACTFGTQAKRPEVAACSASADTKARVTQFDPNDWNANQYTATSRATNDARQRMAFVKEIHSEMKQAKAEDKTVRASKCVSPNASAACQYVCQCMPVHASACQCVPVRASISMVRKVA